MLIITLHRPSVRSHVMPTTKLSIDRTDKRILEHLQRNARASNLELAEAVGLSATPCARRVKRLEESGVIRAVVTLLDEQALGLALTAMISISMDRLSNTQPNRMYTRTINNITVQGDKE